MDERLRRLDSLFAEKVLGLRAYRWDTNSPFQQPHGYDWVLSNEHTELPHYTRSIDSAWEGVRPALAPKFWLTGPAHFYLWFEGMSLEPGQSKASFGSACGRFNVEAKAMHPAEALVLACLRAVGVTEGEMK